MRVKVEWTETIVYRHVFEVDDDWFAKLEEDEVSLSDLIVQLDTTEMDEAFGHMEDRSVVGWDVMDA